ncbi:hypothetical protein DACRYDRAFT_107032 [Dacryopinax primogenitus]|uniref:Uncharacterized protein n=1 Tax=Dacryopinax primogenitus (strain DJM 731) TaxID=1858805 RepID=M5G009_DACPD|nr:uncharacterized protein DACRYDRAFT_107032 [Dacryopinax primogenitus]EJU02089.1 hypothetical protein DACRYDRAFT_107032 [Dacryopinax primogenitus]
MAANQAAPTTMVTQIHLLQVGHIIKSNIVIDAQDNATQNQFSYVSQAIDAGNPLFRRCIVVDIDATGPILFYCTTFQQVEQLPNVIDPRYFYPVAPAPHPFYNPALQPINTRRQWVSIRARHRVSSTITTPNAVRLYTNAFVPQADIDRLRAAYNATHP